jgi:DNA invertase Pin-like site-specific DNA recombinase
VLDLHAEHLARSEAGIERRAEAVIAAKRLPDALDTLIKDTKRRRFDVVVCWRLDRLGRISST